jgi:type II secretory pathway predicted ATPase ExeA
MSELIPVGGDLFSAHRHFGLAEEPFAAPPDSRFFFNSVSSSESLEQMALAIQSHEPVTVITGPAGVGKTLLCRLLRDRIVARTRVSVIENSQLSPDAFLRQMMHDFGAAENTVGPRRLETADTLLRTLRQYLESLSAGGGRAVLVVDAAERLRPALLERLFTLSTAQDGAALLQIILVGRPDLEPLLEAPELRPLRQHIGRRHQLDRLAADEVEPYIERRLWIAHGGTTAAAVAGDGSAFWRVQFTAAAIRAITTLSEGNPRTVNALAERALEAGGERPNELIDASDVVAAARQLELAIPLRVQVESRRYLAAAALVVITIGGLAAARMLNSRETAGNPVPRANLATGRAAITPSSGARPVVDAGGTAEATVAPLIAIESFTIVAGSFRSSERATELAGRLFRVGLPAFIRPTSGPWHLVVVGPYASRDEAETAQRQLGAVQVRDSKIVATAPGA